MHLANLVTLRDLVTEFGAGRLDAHGFVAAWRMQAADLLPMLPPRFAPVLDNMLMQVESSALMAGESCSFSSDDFVTAFEQWLGKAEERLQAV